MATIPCPQCGAPADDDRRNRHRPFCSERCQRLDLSAWLEGDYRIAADPVDPRAHTPAASPERLLDDAT